MKKHLSGIFILSLLAGSRLLFALDQSGPSEGYQEINDKYIAERKKFLDEALQKRIDALNKDFGALQTFEAKMKDDRINFERKIVEDRKAFLDTLKSKPKDGRKEAMRLFNQNQREEARKFREDQKSKREEFKRGMTEEREELLQDLRGESRMQIEHFKEEKKATQKPKK